MQRLLGQSSRYGFFQAVRLIERALTARYGHNQGVLRKHVRFQNSQSLGFAGPELEKVEASAQGKQFIVTPTFIGLLGLHGTLPVHYTEAVHAGTDVRLKEGRLAFLDVLSSRLVALFYEAWKSQRFEFARDDEAASLKPRLLALASAKSGDETNSRAVKLETWFSGLLRQCPVSAVAIEQVLSSYIDMPVELRPGISTHHPIPASCQARIGTSVLGGDTPCVLGSHMRRRDMRCEIVLRPRTRSRALDFIRSGAGAAALKEVLQLFAVSTIEFDVCVSMPKKEIEGVLLDGARALGYDSYLLSRPELKDRVDMRYLLRTL